MSNSGTYFYVEGPLTGWWIHNMSGAGGCHLYTLTTTNANPVNRAKYLLPIDPARDGYYRVDAYINCHHNNAWMKYWVYLFGTGAGVSFTATKIVSGICDNYAQVIAPANYRASQGASILLIDSTGSSSTYQNADMHIFQP